jgi:hypothetical protein
MHGVAVPFNTPVVVPELLQAQNKTLTARTATVISRRR